jgi:hypothetical protein
LRIHQETSVRAGSIRPPCLSSEEDWHCKRIPRQKARAEAGFATD